MAKRATEEAKHKLQARLLREGVALAEAIEAADKAKAKAEKTKGPEQLAAQAEYHDAMAKVAEIRRKEKSRRRAARSRDRYAGPAAVSVASRALALLGIK